MEALDYLRQYLKAYPVSWSADGLDQLINSFELKNLKRGELFLKEGQVSREIALVVSGCLRLYILDEGEEKSIFFFPENYFCADSRSFLSGKPSRCFIDVLEDAELLTVSLDKVRDLGGRFVDVATCNRLLMEKLLVSAENRLM